MHRRQFLKTLPIAIAAASSPDSFAAPPAPRVNTVLGERSPRALGMTLMHEHVLVDFVGADKVSSPALQRRGSFPDGLAPPQGFARRRLPNIGGMHACLSRSGRKSAQTVGRVPRACTSSPTPVFMVLQTTSTCPAIARQETAEQLAARWTREFQEGIDGTGIRPGIIKIGVDPGPLSEIDAKLVRAAAKTHLQTGLTIASHTGDGVAALEELEILKQEGVHPGAFIWVHAQIEGNGQFHLKAAQQGAWVEFDGISESSAEKHLQLVERHDRSGIR